MALIASLHVFVIFCNYRIRLLLNMMSNNVPLVSVIISVYNGEKYIERCLQSVVRQTYQNIEIIVVNDGSVDKTPVIVGEFMKLDSRIVTLDKVNEGLVEARRTGVALAHGKYIQYLDCDDTLIENAIELLVDRAEDTQADIVVAPFFFCEGESKKLSDTIEFEQMSGIEYLKCILNTEAYWTVWSKFHLRSLYIEDIEKLSISFGEDVVLSTQLLIRSEKIVSMNDPILDYYVYSSSMSHNLDEKAYKEFNSYVLWFDDYINRSGLNSKLSNELAFFHVRNTLARLHWRKIEDADREMKRVLAELQTYPDLQRFLSHRERKIITTYRLSALLGYLRLLYYNWRGKL